MSATGNGWKIMRFFLLSLCTLLLAAGCSTAPVAKKELPPILTQEELLRPWQKLGVLEVHRKRYGSSSDVSPEDYAWVYESLRQEAARISADAVIFPEVRVEMDSYYLFPTSEMYGKGVAIKFQ
ncbi:hypothetical protein LPW11_14450 [Geomonas sp. RF6]|uniref:hypothetical protein n=1 Tax=Geomonas sp. RF6 TaxID=2897342 RepID=UPI001E36C095|nr:hypothetical protein [Geomonas sp. RF6]UFS69092.1 hypothetical protein LPW11_14450 [Geomonas sp. RF6]